MRHPLTSALLLVSHLVVLAVAGCAQEQYPVSLVSSADAGAISELDAGGPKGVRVCTQAHSTSLPARLVAMSNGAQSDGTVVLVSDLFQRFQDTCKPCHTNSTDGNFQIVTPTDFTSAMTPAVLQHVTGSQCPKAPDASDPLDPMPPCSSQAGKTYSQRSESDSVKQFAELVTDWLSAKKPDSFMLPSSSGGADAGGDAGGDAGAPSAFTLTPAIGNAMTNLGNCVPSAAMVGIEESKSKTLDAMFEGLQAKPTGSTSDVLGLPEHLGETDLFTLDSATLAQYGVVAYAPGYPLWSDNAGKLRYVRVPRGQSIQFDKTTQQFAIPPNTRFYKTFMKQIIDTDGSYRYRKIETRLIVSRPDQNNADGTVNQTALFGSYRWNDDESDATLVDTPLNDGEPFGDTLLLYNTDEPLAAEVLATQPPDPEEHLLEAKAARHYAIPSKQRCVQCHMGSPSQSFVLGFTPLQINRRPIGMGGTIEATGPDELTQLQRFIDAGIVTGIDSLADVASLEKSQPGRAPRSNFELTAQGYMLGNCAHCHNPRGYPTVQNPVLQGVLDFLPRPDGGGIFQFPLERYSPRIGRGVSGTTPIPYITPSLVDLPRVDPQTNAQAPDIFVSSPGHQVATDVFYGPWRSLIYRNVDNAFAYVDDLAIFPHMPFNTPGYDPRAKQILGDWMVSIPAVRKNPQIVEYAYQVDGTSKDNIGSPVVDESTQPYVEVAPGAPGYEDAVSAAQQRLAILHTGFNAAVPLDPEAGESISRYAQPGETDDILDPAVLLDPVCHPVPTESGAQYSFPAPDHPHWVNTDLTSPPGPWQPRQSTWGSVLVERQVPQINSACAEGAAAESAFADQLDAIDLVQSTSLDQVRDFVATPVPFGLWQQQAGCNFSSEKTVGSFVAGSTDPSMNRPHWMGVVSPPPDAPVYMETPGAAVFKMICINCHGPKADSNGRLAQNLATMTGGNALVADFRDGLFGPVGASEETSNRHAVFGAGALPGNAAQNAPWLTLGGASGGAPLTDDDRASRYMAWMGLGGTSVHIPPELLQIVAVTKVLDQQRVLPSTSLSANMLSQAKALCQGTLGPDYAEAKSEPYAVKFGSGHGVLDGSPYSFTTPLLLQNYDADLWLRLCALANPSPVHVLHPIGDPTSLGIAVEPIEAVGGFATLPDAMWSGTYPTTDPSGNPTQIGNDRGGVDSTLIPCTAQNTETCNKWPWCVDDTTASPAQAAWIASSGLPTCPPQVKDASLACTHSLPPQDGACFDDAAANRWAVRGAINAGMSVFLYVQSIENSTPPPDYNQCDLLK